MTKQDALSILRQGIAQVSTNLQQHQIMQEALGVVADALEPPRTPPQMDREQKFKAASAQ